MRKGLPCDWADDWSTRRAKSQTAIIHKVRSLLVGKHPRFAVLDDIGADIPPKRKKKYVGPQWPRAWLDPLDDWGTSSTTNNVPWYVSGSTTGTQAPGTGGVSSWATTTSTSYATAQTITNQRLAAQVAQYAPHPQPGYGAGQYPGLPATPAAAQAALAHCNQSNQALSSATYNQLLQLANQGGAAITNAIMRGQYFDDDVERAYREGRPTQTPPVDRVWGHRKVNKGDAFKLDLPDGSQLVVGDDGNYTITDDKAKISYEANRFREFNKFLNASDIIEDFIRYCGGLGLKTPDISQLPVELLIRFLIIRAAEADGETVEEKDRLTFEEMSRKVLTFPALPAPQQTLVENEDVASVAA